MKYMLIKGSTVCTCDHFIKLLGIAKAIEWAYYGIGFGAEASGLDPIQGWTGYDPIGKVASGDFVQIYPIIDEAKFDSTTVAIQIAINAGPGSVEKISLGQRNNYKTNVATALAAHVADNPVAI